jgi:hypothetical protein
MLPSIPTIGQILTSHCTASGFCLWPVQGGAITISRDELRQHLEEAYDPHDPSWPVFVDIPEADA